MGPFPLRAVVGWGGRWLCAWARAQSRPPHRTVNSLFSLASAGEVPPGSKMAQVHISHLHMDEQAGEPRCPWTLRAGLARASQQEGSPKDKQAAGRGLRTRASKTLRLIHDGKSMGPARGLSSLWTPTQGQAQAQCPQVWKNPSAEACEAPQKSRTCSNARP